MQTLKRLLDWVIDPEKVALHLLVENTSAAALIESLNQAKALQGL